MSNSNYYWYRACSADEIPRRGSIRVSHGETKIAIFKTANNELFALEDKCPHKGGPLSAGIVHNNCVTCPLHNWDISLESGQALGVDEGSTSKFKVQVEDDIVMVYVKKPSALSVA